MHAMLRLNTSRSTWCTMMGKGVTCEWFVLALFVIAFCNSSGRMYLGTDLATIVDRTGNLIPTFIWKKVMRPTPTIVLKTNDENVRLLNCMVSSTKDWSFRITLSSYSKQYLSFSPYFFPSRKCENTPVNNKNVRVITRTSKYNTI